MQVLPLQMQELLPIRSTGCSAPASCLQIQSYPAETRCGMCYSEGVSPKTLWGIGSTREVETEFITAVTFNFALGLWGLTLCQLLRQPVQKTSGSTAEDLSGKGQNAGTVDLESRRERVRPWGRS